MPTNVGDMSPIPGSGRWKIPRAVEHPGLRATAAESVLWSLGSAATGPLSPRTCAPPLEGPLRWETHAPNWTATLLAARESPSSGRDAAQPGNRSYICVQNIYYCILYATPWTMELSKPEHWSGQPFPYPGDLPNPGIRPRSPALRVDSLPAEPQEKPYDMYMVAYPQVLVGADREYRQR